MAASRVSDDSPEVLEADSSVNDSTVSVAFASELCVRLTALPWFETLMLVTRLGSTPKIWAMMSAVIAFPAASHAGDTMVVTLAMHLLSPPHTPQLSSVYRQQMPEGGKGVEQHVPSTSSATPVPLHTPHASTRPPTQQEPRLSTVLPVGQHTPVFASTGPVQQSPSTSTTPWHGLRSVVLVSSGTSHPVPAQPGAHPQLPLVVLHTE